MAVIVVLSLIVLVIVICSVMKESEVRNESMNIVETSVDFDASKTIKGVTCGAFVLSINDEKQKVFCAVYTDRRYFDYSDILSVEMLVNGSTIESKKSILGTVGGALLGGAIGGATGAVVGGLSSKSTSSTTIDSIQIHVVFKNISTKPLDIIFHATKYTEGVARKEARQIMDLFKIMIDQADSTKQHQPQNGNQTISTVDELRKIADLRASGIITDDELEKLKKRILGEN